MLLLIGAASRKRHSDILETVLSATWPEHNTFKARKLGTWSETLCIEIWAFPSIWLPQHGGRGCSKVRMDSHQLNTLIAIKDILKFSPVRGWSIIATRLSTILESEAIFWNPEKADLFSCGAWQEDGGQSQCTNHVTTRSEEHITSSFRN